VVAKALPPERVATLLGPAARALADALAKERDPLARRHRAAGLAEVAKALPSQQAAQALADALVKERDPDEREALAAGLAQAVSRLPTERAAQQLIDCRGRCLDVSAVLSPAIRELASHASLEHAVEWLKHPLCYGEAAAAILSQIKTPDGKTFGTRRELVEW